MYKLVGWIVAVVLAAGCSRHHGVDTGPLASSFERSEPTLRQDADKAIAAIKAGNLPDALTQLDRLGKRAKLSAEQQKAVQDTIAQIQKQMEQAAKAAAEDAPKALPQKK
jgi:ribosome assembly protein YihI (activator of Der GTPase)